MRSGGTPSEVRAPATAVARALLGSVFDDHLWTLFVMGWLPVPDDRHLRSDCRAMAIEVALRAARRSRFVRRLVGARVEAPVNTTTTLAPSV
jgi:hypothetical protein